MIDARNRAILTLSNGTSRRQEEIVEAFDELSKWLDADDWERAKFASMSVHRLCEQQAVECKQLEELREGTKG